MRLLPSAPLYGPTHPNDRPFRDPDLTNDDAYELMAEATALVLDASLAARRLLLSAGFADAHTMCADLDHTARHWADIRGAVFHQRARDRSWSAAGGLTRMVAG